VAGLDKRSEYSRFTFTRMLRSAVSQDCRRLLVARVDAIPDLRRFCHLRSPFACSRNSQHVYCRLGSVCSYVTGSQVSILTSHTLPQLPIVLKITLKSKVTIEVEVNNEIEVQYD
jgi:hypothetical protein